MKNLMTGVLLAIALLLSVSACTDKGAKKKVLYYVNPMDPTVKSDKPMKDSMGMDYIPVYAEQGPKKPKKILYYRNPMDPAIRSDKPMQDSMGMDYIPVYEGEVVTAAPIHSHGQQTETGPVSSIKLSADEEKKISVQLITLSNRVMERSIRTVGQINFDERRWVHVSSRITGRIENLLVNYSGIRVNKGQSLLELYSPALITAQEEMLQLYRTYTEALSANDEQGAALTKGLYESARKKLSLWGLSDAQIASILQKNASLQSVPVLSPITGTVIKVYPAAGMYVNEGEMLYEIASLSEVWLEAEVYEQDLASVRNGSAVDIQTVSYPGRTFSGRITFINPTVDPVTRTIRIRANIPNPGELLKPGMYVDAVVKSGETGKRLAVPETAVLDTGERKLVYVYLGDGQYEGRSVILEAKNGQLYPVVAGLKAGERVVTDGVYLIDSQAQLKGSYNIRYNSH